MGLRRTAEQHTESCEGGGGNMIEKRSLTGYHWDDIEDLFDAQCPDTKEMECLIRFYDYLVDTVLDGNHSGIPTWVAGEITTDDVTHAEINEDKEWLRAFEFLRENKLITPIKNQENWYEFTFII